MSSKQRYFKNPYEDFIDGQNVELDREKIVGLIKNYVEKIQSNTKPHESDGRGDLYVGDAGIAYMFLKLHNSELHGDYPALELASTYIDKAKKNASQNPEKQAALLSGNAGINAVAFAVSKTLKKGDEQKKDLKRFLEGFKVCSNRTFKVDEFLVGRAGYLAGCYFVNQVQPGAIDFVIISTLTSIILARGQKYSSTKDSGIPLMYQYHGSEYLGAAHGLFSILWVLLEGTQSETNLILIKDTIDSLMRLQDENGDFPTKWSSRDKKLVHWCHGSPGAFYLYAKAFMVFNESKYLEVCQKCCDSVWEKGLLLKGPGICHGIAGNGYTFLIMYRLTGDSKYLYRAGKFMEFLDHDEFKQDARTPDRPFSLYEGLAGTVCFLMDLLKPDQAAFPFMDIFCSSS